MIDMKQEQTVVWKTYPKYPFIEANQFGAIKTKDRYVPCKNGSKRLVRGRVLKQRSTKGGYMYVSVSVDNKQKHLLVHRIVASCFLPNPDNLPEVNHRDNSPANNVVSNLEWCTSKYNTAYREKYGITAREATKALRKPVVSVNLKTFKVLRFESQSEAARQLGVSRRHVNNVIKGRCKTAGGYWFTEDESEITKEKIQEIKAITPFLDGVVAINLKTCETVYFKTQNGAERQLGVSRVSINHVLRGKQKTAGGYWFCYADSKAVESVRERLGNKVAYEVEKLMDKN